MSLAKGCFHDNDRQSCCIGYPIPYMVEIKKCANPYLPLKVSRPTCSKELVKSALFRDLQETTATPHMSLEMVMEQKCMPIWTMGNAKAISLGLDVNMSAS
jgi:hypothetical protein